jgi:hypothetical protein
MPTKFHLSPRASVAFTGAAALVGWLVALMQALPRLTAGPLCSARSDVWSLAGHCPACFAAVALSLLFLAAVLGAREEAVHANTARR